MMTDEQRIAMFVQIHKDIETCADAMARSLEAGGELPKLSYPPNAGLTEDEAAALRALELDSRAVAGLRKLTADAISSCLFTLFNLLDGTGEPEGFDEYWPAFSLVEESDDDEVVEMLHDTFFDTYWNWRRVRPDPGWKLDTLDD